MGYRVIPTNDINLTPNVAIGVKFPFDGKFLIKKGIQEGKKIGIILKEAEQVWLQNNFNLSSKEFEVVIKKNTISN